MALRKNPKYDIKLHYKRTLEISLIISLFVIIAAFKFSPDFVKSVQIVEKPQPIIDLLDIPKTADPIPPPPPPKPRIEIAAPEDIPGDIPFDETDLKKNIDVPPPPPPLSDNDEKENIVVPFWKVEEKPQIIGGVAGIASRVKYPELARQVGIQGTVFIEALVSETGTVESAVVQKGINGGCDEEALRVVLETRFTPGKQRGKAVKVKVSIPIKFRLQ